MNTISLLLLVLLLAPPEQGTPLMGFYQKKKREKGSGKAICATARKLLTIIFVMLKKELDYWYLEDCLYNRKLRALNAAA
jgi:hypothetical protein